MYPMQPEDEPKYEESFPVWIWRKTGGAAIAAFKESWKEPARVQLALDEYCMGNPDYEEGQRPVVASSVRIDVNEKKAYFVCQDIEHTLDWQENSHSRHLTPLVDVSISDEKILELLEAGAQILPNIEPPSSRNDVHKSLVNQGRNRKDVLGSLDSRILERKHGLDL